jgi:hypothetical protein
MEDNETKTRELLFNIAVYLQSDPEQITQLSLARVPIPEALMNTLSIALQVMYAALDT